MTPGIPLRQGFGDWRTAYSVERLAWGFSFAHFPASACTKNSCKSYRGGFDPQRGVCKVRFGGTGGFEHIYFFLSKPSFGADKSNCIFAVACKFHGGFGLSIERSEDQAGVRIVIFQMPERPGEVSRAGYFRQKNSPALPGSSNCEFIISLDCGGTFCQLYGSLEDDRGDMVNAQLRTLGQEPVEALALCDTCSDYYSAGCAGRFAAGHLGLERNGFAIYVRNNGPGQCAFPIKKLDMPADGQP
jgi:hypothetical protein